MNFGEEKFVKVFIRDTPTWICWPWEARALAPLLMRKMEGEGRLAVGRMDKVRAVAVTVGLPEEVVKVGLAAMVEDGTIEYREDGIWWPKFEEAQESRKSDAQRQRERRARLRAEQAEITKHHRHTASHTVTSGHTASLSSTEQPRTDQHNPEQTNTAPRTDQPPAVGSGGSEPVRDPPEPPLQLESEVMKEPDAVDVVFAYWQKKMGKGRAVLDADRREAIEGALKLGYSVDQLKRAVDGCKLDPWSMGENDRGKVYNDIKRICADARRVEMFLGYADRPPTKGTPRGNATAADTQWTDADYAKESYFDDVG